MGVADGYEPGALAPFVNSLRRTGFDGDTVFFARNLPHATRAYLHAHGVTLVDFARLDLPGIRYLRKLALRMFLRTPPTEAPSARQQTLIRRLWHCQASRYLFYRDYLRAHPTRYARVLLIDLRDTYFQGAPFADPRPGDLCAFEETAALTIAEESSNHWWIERLYGAEGLRRLGPRPVLCSGATIGSAHGVRNYLERMIALLYHHHGPRGYDQGVHNYLVWERGLPGATVCAFGQGPVMNIGTADRASFQVGEDGTVLRTDGTACPIVHQYDRHGDLLRHAEREFGLASV